MKLTILKHLNNAPITPEIALEYATDIWKMCELEGKPFGAHGFHNAQVLEALNFLAEHFESSCILKNISVKADFLSAEGVLKTLESYQAEAGNINPKNGAKTGQTLARKKTAQC